MYVIVSKGLAFYTYSLPWFNHQTAQQSTKHQVIVDRLRLQDRKYIARFSTNIKGNTDCTAFLVVGNSPRIAQSSRVGDS